MRIGDTIAAVSTPRGKGGVALLRVSGREALAVCERVFQPKNRKALSQATARIAVYGNILAPDADGEWRAVDDGLATYFPAPHSFTGEDTVELCCHGGVLLTQTVLTALLAAGARPAEAGEFTRRAFLNGKMGLSSAEALGNILEAQTKDQLTLAYNGMGGRVEARCRGIYESIRDILASIYVRIDYPDEDLADMSREEIMGALEACHTALNGLIGTYSTGRAVAEGIPTVICGRPNAGKSTLYNLLVGREAAIVTDIEGTTRDILSESTSLGCVTLRLFDTAGLRTTENPVEQIGIARAKEALDSAELILAVFDVSRSPDGEDLRLMEELRSCTGTVIAVLNKSDAISSPIDAHYREAFANTVTMSAKEGKGLEELTALVEALFTDGAIDLRNDAILTNARQHAATLRAREAVERSLAALGAGMPLELCCSDAEDAMSALCELDGRSISEDIVAQIFSRFCVGK